MKKSILVMGILLWLGTGIGMAEDPAALKTSAPVTVEGAAAIQPASTASPAGKINAADTAWILMSAALVMLMTPGLALF